MPKDHCDWRYLIFVSDMSFGALSEEAKISLAKGAQMAERVYVLAKVDVKKKSRTIDTRRTASGQMGHRKSKQVQAFI